MTANICPFRDMRSARTGSFKGTFAGGRSVEGGMLDVGGADSYFSTDLTAGVKGVFGVTGSKSSWAELRTGASSRGPS